MQERIAERQSGSIGYRAPSYGLFRTSLTPEYWYGLPRNVRADGLGMDVDRAINLRVDRHDNADNWVAFNRAQGSRMSAMEHLVPEQMFSTEAAPANGISAVKAIQLAAAEGQRIYTITRANVDVALAQINLSSDIEAEIRHAAQAGLEVTAHQQPVSFFGRPSVGYIILDPVTATGAYKIGGGENGSYLGGLFIGMALSLAVVMAISFSGGIGLPILLSSLVHAGVFSLIESFVSGDGLDRRCFVSGLFSGLMPLGVILVPLFGSFQAAVQSILAFLGYGNVIVDLDGSRESCLGG